MGIPWDMRSPIFADPIQVSTVDISPCCHLTNSVTVQKADITSRNWLTKILLFCEQTLCQTNPLTVWPFWAIRWKQYLSWKNHPSSPKWFHLRDPNRYRSGRYALNKNPAFSARQSRDPLVLVSAAVLFVARNLRVRTNPHRRHLPLHGRLLLVLQLTSFQYLGGKRQKQLQTSTTTKSSAVKDILRHF